MASFALGVFATWLFLYGLTPALQGWVATAMGGLDLSWLAGSLVAAAAYAVLGGPYYRRHYSSGSVVVGDKAEPVAVPVMDK